MMKPAPPQVRAPIGLRQQLANLHALNACDRAVLAEGLRALSTEVAMVRAVQKAQPERIQEFLGRQARHATIDALATFVRNDLLAPLHHPVHLPRK